MLGSILLAYLCCSCYCRRYRLIRQVTYMSGTTLLRGDGRPETLMLADNRHPALAKSPCPQSRHHQGPIAINAPATSHIISDGTVYVHLLSSLSLFCARAHFSAQFRKKFPPFFISLASDDDAYATFSVFLFSRTPRSRRGKKRIRVCSSLRPPTNPPEIIGYWNVAAVERAWKTAWDRGGLWFADRWSVA